METQHWLETARDCGYVSEKQMQHLLKQYQSIGRILGSMISKPTLFCTQASKAIREPELEYFFDSANTQLSNDITDYR